MKIWQSIVEFSYFLSPDSTRKRSGIAACCNVHLRSLARPPRPPVRAAKAPGEGQHKQPPVVMHLATEIEWGLFKRFELWIGLRACGDLMMPQNLYVINKCQQYKHAHFVQDGLIAEVARLVISVRSLLQHLPHLAPQARFGSDNWWVSFLGADFFFLGGGFKYFLVSPLHGEMIQFD